MGQDKLKASPEDRERIQEWLNEKWVSPKACPICTNPNWVIAEHLIAPPVSSGGGLSIGGPTYPFVMVTCTNCAHTHLFNAAAILRTSKSQKPEGGGDG